MKVLDCTLRDGGYYNNWDFDLEAVERTISGLNRAGVDIIEIGYKSLPDRNFYGLFKYCNDDYLAFLNEYQGAEYAFMIDVKEFVNGGSVDDGALDTIIRPRKESVFQWCRLATGFHNLEHMPQMCAYFRDKGYRLTVNLMGISLLGNEQIKEALSIISTARPEVFYFADSFGSMYPGDISRLIGLMKRHYKGDIGLHTHDNQGLAFVNSVTGLREGAAYIDATLTGMGRGAGNLQLEQFLLWYSQRQDAERYQPNELLDVINDYYLNLKNQYGWGFNYLYMLSGLKNIHPSYCMAISNGTKFTLSMSQITTVLESIDNEQRAAFSQDVLNESINRSIARSTATPRAALPLLNVDQHRAQQNECLIVAPGPGLNKYKFAIDRFLAAKQIKVIECNHTRVLDTRMDRCVVVLNKERLHEIRNKTWFNDVIVITGQKEAEQTEQTLHVYHFDYEIGPFEIQQTKVLIPDFEAGQYAIALAICLGYEQIYLAGFEGYEENAHNAAMNDFFDSVTRRYENVELTAITPTRYNNIERRSIFTF